MVFEGTAGVYERIYHFKSKCFEYLRKKNMRIRNGFCEIASVSVLIQVMIT